MQFSTNASALPRITGQMKNRYCPRCQRLTLQAPLEASQYPWHCVRCAARVAEDESHIQDRRAH